VHLQDMATAAAAIRLFSAGRTLSVELGGDVEGVGREADDRVQRRSRVLEGVDPVEQRADQLDGGEGAGLEPLEQVVRVEVGEVGAGGVRIVDRRGHGTSMARTGRST